MTWYEIIISRPDDKAVVIEGRDLLQAALALFDAAAKNRRVPGFDRVNLYDECPVSGDVLREVLEELKEDDEWVDASGEYQVLLSEI